MHNMVRLDWIVYSYHQTWHGKRAPLTPMRGLCFLDTFSLAIAMEIGTLMSCVSSGRSLGKGIFVASLEHLVLKDVEGCTNRKFRVTFLVEGLRLNGLDVLRI